MSHHFHDELTKGRIIDWVDPLTQEPLKFENGYLQNKNIRYRVINGIPNFVNNLNDPIQEQVKTSFGEKWTNTKFGQDAKEYNEKIKPIYLEMMGLTENDLSVFDNKLVLDAGIGSGSFARLCAPRAKEFHGIDISKSVHVAKKILSTVSSNPVLAQADLNHLPYKDESFDIIVSNGVFHHTPNTKLALKNSIKKLKQGGICIFYIYKKKSPIREFSDDFIRSKISDLSYNEAWEKIKQLTNFGKSLAHQKIKLSIHENIDLLDIKKGKYDLQQFFYDYIFKCFWNETWGYDYSNSCNFDWYHPKYCWRHTESEIRSWCAEFNLTINYLKELQSGFACWVIKTKIV